MRYIVVGLFALLVCAPYGANAEESETVNAVQPHVFDDLDGDGQSDRAAALQGFNPGREGDQIEEESLPYPPEELTESNDTGTT